MALNTVSEVKTRYRFTPGEFDWDTQSSSALTARIGGWLGEAADWVAQAVGASTYAAATSGTLQGRSFKRAELDYALMLGLNDSIRILSSRPEEAPPPEFVDLNVLERLRDELKLKAHDWLVPYRTDSSKLPNMAFAVSSEGIDETELDDYATIDFGTLTGTG